MQQMKVRILTDSASDFSLDELKEKNVELIPMPLLCGGTTYIDDKTIPMEAFWDMLIKGTNIKTSQPSPEVFVKSFERAKEAGEAVICILISSKLSGTLQGAILARSMADYESIYIIDAKGAAATAAEKLLVYRACELREQGKDALEIAAELEQFRDRIRLFACLDTLEYLARGGRLPKSVANVGSVLRIKPIICFSKEGEIHVKKKAVGAKQALREMTELAMSAQISKDYPVIPLYAQNNGNCLEYMEALSKAGFSGQLKEPEGIGATIGTYIGPGGYGVVFVEK